MALVVEKSLVMYKRGYSSKSNLLKGKPHQMWEREKVKKPTMLVKNDQIRWLMARKVRARINKRSSCLRPNHSYVTNHTRHGLP